ncbi:RNB domain-containing ribonuclease [Hankyongella ginsenosidimutans]|uniref:RNB domain-containing ribonuclease n=1 Tax=Hankyongella ginsenosidimutans TaxID=1763828 RepID=A0A4D7CAY2_9SPHN|nr:ribonuclease catalytic domain-containing protein [Hankyongella ginsenosidimutans]QCI78646.1 RNB domain-containing ribonuclease [Hankyongella ginsenosidimutans]
MPFVAIDPLDARDHDDAIWAEPVEGGGWRIAVAIADVSYYVRPGDAIDREAHRRGNSAYFPDRVVPMLPEALSADACSLKAGTDKAALVCHMSVGPRGAVTGFRFERARIRLAANIAYENAQAVIDAQAGDALPLLEPLWGLGARSMPRASGANRLTSICRRSASNWTQTVGWSGFAAASGSMRTGWSRIS